MLLINADTERLRRSSRSSKTPCRGSQIQRRCHVLKPKIYNEKSRLQVYDGKVVTAANQAYNFLEFEFDG